PASGGIRVTESSIHSLAVRAIAVLMLCAGIARAQPRTIHGVVTVAGSLRPIAGATVLTEHGDIAVTDLDGYFTLSVGTGERELSIAATGYAQRTVSIASDSLRIELEPSQGAEVIEVTGKAPEQ